MVNMGLFIADVFFKNPVITASGTFGFGREYNEFYPIGRLGGVSCKGTTLFERPGNPSPRIAETPSGILNSVGLQNPGIEHFINEDLGWLKQQDTVAIANIAGSTIEEYCK
ncbi:MAG: dihydroorotate dehydrogenase, partial [Oscillospiraceae bacterium]